MLTPSNPSDSILLPLKVLITSIYSINNFLEVEKYDNESTHLVSFDVKFSCIGYFLMSSSTPGLDLKDKRLHNVMLGTNFLIKCLLSYWLMIKIDEKMCRQVSMMSWLNMYNLLKRPVDRCRLQIYMSMHLGGCWPHAWGQMYCSLNNNIRRWVRTSSFSKWRHITSVLNFLRKIRESSTYFFFEKHLTVNLDEILELPFQKWAVFVNWIWPSVFILTVSHRLQLMSFWYFSYAVAWLFHRCKTQASTRDFVTCLN